MGRRKLNSCVDKNYIGGNERGGKRMDTEQLKIMVNDLIVSHRYDEIKPLLLANKDTTEHDNTLSMTCYLCTVHEREKEAGQLSILSKVSDLDELIDRYTRLKFFLRRIDFDLLDEGLEDFYAFITQYKISSYELLAAIEFGVVHKDKVLKVIKGE